MKSVQRLVYEMVGLGFEFRLGQESFVLFKTSRLSLGQTHPPIHEESEFFSGSKTAAA